MLGEGGVIVEGHRFAQRRIEPAEHAHHDGDGLGGGLAGEPSRQCHPRFAFMQNQDRAGALADDQIGLPMAGLLPVCHRIGAIVDRGSVLDGGAGLSGAQGAACSAPPGRITPQLLRLLPGTVEEGVNRFSAHRTQAGLVGRPQPSGDLFGRPAFGQAVADKATEPLILLDCRVTLPAQQIGSVCMARRIAPIGQSIAAQFAADCRFGPAERSGNRAERISSGG